MTTLNIGVLMTATFRSPALQKKRIVAFPRQQWSRERATILRNPYIVFFVLLKNGPGLAKGDNRIFWKTVILDDFWTLDRSNKEFSRYSLTFGSLEGILCYGPGDMKVVETFSELKSLSLGMALRSPIFVAHSQLQVTVSVTTVTCWDVSVESKGLFLTAELSLQPSNIWNISPFPIEHKQQFRHWVTDDLFTMTSRWWFHIRTAYRPSAITACIVLRVNCCGFF
jgi:hypothetical protein